MSGLKLTILVMMAAIIGRYTEMGGRGVNNKFIFFLHVLD